MPPCQHKDLEFVGEQKTDNGVNSYLRCRTCNEVIVMTPEGKVIGIKGRP